MADYNVTGDSTTVQIDGDFPTADADPYALPPPVTRLPDDYTALITPWQSTKARFVATVRAQVAPQCDAQAFVASLPQAFDLDEAIGAQLDIVGQWIGRDRYVPIPLPDTTFALDIEGRGLDQGYWRTGFDATDAISALPDELFRPLLYAKVLANSWDGTAAGALVIVRTYLADPATLIFVNDDARAVVPHTGDAIFSLDVAGAGLEEGRWAEHGEYPATPERLGISYAIGIAGILPSRTDLYILANDLLPVKGMGADVRVAVTTVDGAPLFGLDMDTDEVSGLDVGAWGADPAAVAATLPV